MPLKEMEMLERMAGRLAHCVNELVSDEDAGEFVARFAAELTDRLMGESAGELSLSAGAEEAPGARSDAPRTALLAQGDAETRENVRPMLERMGYEVLEAASGDDALALCRDYPGRISLLLTDVLMPDMSGRELAERAALLHREMAVLYLSSYAEEDMLASGMLASGAVMLGKPATGPALASKVAAALGQPVTLGC